LDTSDIAGEREIRASLHAGQGTVIGTDSKSIVLDNTKPTNLKLVEAQQVANGLVEVTVTGEDPESQIQEVKFHMGKVDDQNPPKGPALAESVFDNDQKSLTKKVPVNQIGDIDLTAEFINGVRMSAYLPIKITMVPPNPPGGNAGQGKPGSISGKVDLNGNRQPRAKLTLEGAPLKNPLTENADDKGEFLFKEVPPGVYKLSAVPEFGGAKGHITVTVKPGEAKTGQTVSVSR